MNSKRQLLRMAAALPLAGVLSPARAQEYPARPVTFVVPNAPGGLLDVLARMLQPHLQALWRQPLVVQYKPGATTSLGTEFTAKSAPDGYTACVITTPHVINPAMKKLSFDTARDLSGVSMLGVSSSLVSASPQFPAATFTEAIDLIRKNPRKYSYASPGAGSSMHLAMELLKQRAGLDLLHVPFKGSGEAYPEVFAGRVDLLIDPLFPTLNHVKSGRLEALAVTGSARAAVAPTVPSISESFPDFGVYSLFGLVVPGGTPRAVVARLHRDVAAVLQRPDVASQFMELGLEPQPLQPEQMDALIRKEIDRWTVFVKSANIPTE